MQQNENPPPYTQAYGPPPTQVGFEQQQQQGYPKPQQGYPGPQQGYPGPQQGYVGPQQGYPPQQGYGAPYPPQQQGMQGMQQQSNTTVVIAQPGVATNTVVHAHVPDYTVGSILACLCCFPLTGLLAIYFAQRSRTELVLGNIGEAQILAARARNLIVTSVILGVVWIVVSRTELAVGNVGEAQYLAARARNLIVTSVVLGVVWIIVVIVVNVTATTTCYYSNGISYSC